MPSNPFFGFMSMAGTYESRCVGRFDGDGGLFVSTAAVTDARKPYETAVGHPRYNDANLIVVATYDTREEAAEGHARWLATMTAGELPPILRDVSESDAALMLDEAAESWREHALRSNEP